MFMCCGVILIVRVFFYFKSTITTKTAASPSPSPRFLTLTPWPTCMSARMWAESNVPGGVSLGHWHLGFRSKYGHGAPLSQSEGCKRDCRRAANERGPRLNGRRERGRKERRAEDKCGGSAGKRGEFWLSGRALSGALDFDSSRWRLVLRAV